MIMQFFLHTINASHPNLLQRLMLPLRSRARRTALKKTLLQMDDHMLSDIGLRRHQVLGDLF